MPLWTIFGDHLSVRCFRLRSSKIDVSTFEDHRCVDLRRSISKINVSTVKDQCEIMLLHLLKTLMLYSYSSMRISPGRLHFSAFIDICGCVVNDDVGI